MDKQQILQAYQSLDKAGKDRIGRLVQEHLREQGFDLSNQAIHHWRKTPDYSGHLEQFYLKAYQYAFNQQLETA